MQSYSRKMITDIYWQQSDPWSLAVQHFAIQEEVIALACLCMHELFELYYACI